MGDSVSEHPPISVLIVDPSPSVSEQIADILRTAGYEVEALHAAQMEDIRNFIEYRPLDLIMVRPGEGPPTIAEISEQVKAADQDIPILAVEEPTTQQRPVEWLRAGADNVFALQDPEHLLLVVGKELRHLTIRRQARSQELRLQESEERSRALLDNSRDAVAYIHEGVHAYANPAYLKLFGFTNAADLEEVTLINLIARQDRDKLKRFLRRSIKAGKSVGPVDLTGLDSGERPFPLRMECIPTRMNDEPCLQVLIQNPSEREDFEKRLAEANQRDALTGLYNRHFFTDFLTQLCQSPNPRGALFYILLADYRSIGEQLGLEAADQLVKELAASVQGLLSEHSILAHFSDAVVTVYTPDPEPKAALELGEGICNAIREHATHVAQRLVSTTASVGICLIQSTHKNAAQLLAWADRACETARQMGGNQVQVYTPPESKTKLVRQQQEALVAQIRSAISGERLQLLFQPIVSFQGNTVERYKAYLRIHDENQQPVSLEVLAPLAESQGLMRPLDKWTIGRALETLLQRQRQGGKPATLFIRVSNNLVQEKDFCEWLDKRLKDSGLSGNALVLEVTEECAEQYFKETKSLREGLQHLGCGLALSHFGGKAHSARILAYLHPDYIKLDSALIEKLAKAKDETSRLAMTAIVEKAQELHTQIVAADIATAPQMASIWQFGVTLVQGDMVQEASPQLDFDFQQFAG